MICENCEQDYEIEELRELVTHINCLECWRDYWEMNNLGEEESFQDFKNYTLSKIPLNKKVTKNE